MLRDVLNQINHVTRLLLESSLAVDQNSAIQRNNEIVWANYKNLSFSLKDEDYLTQYESCMRERDFVFQLLDGAFVQMKYEFENDEITSHVLGYFPSPKIDNFQDFPDEFENTFYGNVWFAENRDRYIVAFPLRFDYSEVHEDRFHPRSHASLGNFTDCRIPVRRPLSPNIFVEFILRNFYTDKFREFFDERTFLCGLRIADTITANEQTLLHFNVTSGVQPL